MTWLEYPTPFGAGRLDLAGEPVDIGRGEACRIRLDHGLVSRLHARVEPGPQGWALTEWGSTNGTRLNGRPVLGSVPLRPGDVIEIGGFAIQVRGEEPPAWSSTAPDPVAPPQVDGDAPRRRSRLLGCGPVFLVGMAVTMAGNYSRAMRHNAEQESRAAAVRWQEASAQRRSSGLDDPAAAQERRAASPATDARRLTFDEYDGLLSAEYKRLRSRWDSATREHKGVASTPDSGEEGIRDLQAYLAEYGRACRDLSAALRGVRPPVAVERLSADIASTFDDLGSAYETMGGQVRDEAALGRDGPLGEHQRAFHREIERGTQRLGQLIDDAGYDERTFFDDGRLKRR